MTKKKKKWISVSDLAVAGFGLFLLGAIVYFITVAIFGKNL